MVALYPAGYHGSLSSSLCFVIVNLPICLSSLLVSVQAVLGKQLAVFINDGIGMPSKWQQHA
jgi:hypothetical protein